MHIRSLLLGSVALAGLSVAFAAPDAGSGGGAAGLPLGDALKLLDPKLDTDWNKGGQPDLERLRALTGNTALKRDDILAAAPDLQRSNAPARPEQSEVAKAASVTGAAAAPAAEGELDETVDPPDDEEAPGWAKALMAKLDRYEASLAAGGSGHQPARDVIDGPLSNVQAALDPNASNAADRPYAAPTSTAQGPEGSSADIATPRKDFAKTDAGRRHADMKRGEVKEVEMVAIAVGFYHGIKSVGQRFMFTGIPGSWMIRANDPDLPEFLSGAKDAEDAKAKWGLSIG